MPTCHKLLFILVSDGPVAFLWAAHRPALGVAGLVCDPFFVHRVHSILLNSLPSLGGEEAVQFQDLALESQPSCWLCSSGRPAVTQ